MNASVKVLEQDTAADLNGRYARAISASKRVRWDIDADVIRGRRFDLSHRFLPNGLSKVDELAFLSDLCRHLEPTALRELSIETVLREPVASE